MIASQSRFSGRSGECRFLVSFSAFDHELTALNEKATYELATHQGVEKLACLYAAP